MYVDPRKRQAIFFEQQARVLLGHFGLTGLNAEILREAADLITCAQFLRAAICEGEG